MRHAASSQIVLAGGILETPLLSPQLLLTLCCTSLFPAYSYVATDMSSWKGHKTTAEGADTPVWLALLPPGDFKTGGFYWDRQEHVY